ncbi:GNAT family N-acetyltransferase [Bacteroidales bacterium]
MTPASKISSSHFASDHRAVKRLFELREWTISDAQSLAKHANNKNVWKSLRDSFPSPYSLANAESYIMTVLEKSGPPVDFAIEVEGEAAGGIGIILLNDVERGCAEIGYWLGEAHWNRGIMTQVLKEISEYAFAHFTLHKIFATVFSFNTASQKVLEKAGFEKEAILKQAAIKNNQICDVLYYSLFLKSNP